MVQGAIQKNRIPEKFIQKRPFSTIRTKKLIFPSFSPKNFEQFKKKEVVFLMEKNALKDQKPSKNDIFQNLLFWGNFNKMA